MKPPLQFVVAVLSAAMVVVSGCVNLPAQPPGGYYQNDRPPQVAVNINAVADAIPQPQNPARRGNKPYTVFGKTYFPRASANGFVQHGIASWYGEKFHGRRTASGEVYDMFAMTAAHPTLPLPTYVRVTNFANAKSVVVKVNDRGPFLHDRILDLSYVAARKLEIVEVGTARVEVRALASASTKTGSTKPPQAFIQIGAYANPDNARRMREKLRAAGFAVAVTNAAGVSGGMRRVQVGPFATQQIAQQKLRELEIFLRQAVRLVWN